MQIYLSCCFGTSAPTPEHRRVGLRIGLLAAFLAAMPLRYASAGKDRDVSLSKMVGDSGLIARAIVVDVDPYAYDGVEGAGFTAVTFEVTDTLLGEWADPTITLFIRGGFAPDGTYEAWSHMPSFAPGERHMLCLRSGPYHVSPLCGGSASTVQEVDIDGKSVFVDSEGRLIEDLTESGYSRSHRVADFNESHRAAALGEKLTGSAAPFPRGHAERTAVARAKSCDEVIAKLRSRIATDRVAFRTAASLQLHPDPIRLSPDPDPGPDNE